MSSIKLWVNGEERPSVAGTTVAGLLESLEIQAVRVAVEHNGRILRRDEFVSVRLAAGDRLEIVQFVGGG